MEASYHSNNEDCNTDAHDCSVETPPQYQYGEQWGDKQTEKCPPNR